MESASAVNVLPLTNLQDATAVSIEGVAPPRPGQEITVGYRVIDQNYFRTLGIPLLEGRYFTERDNDESHGVVIISKTMALRYWPNDSPLGSVSSHSSRLREFRGARSRITPGLMSWASWET